MDGLEYFSLYKDTPQLIEPLTMEERGQLFTAICEYAFTGVLPSVDGGARYVFPVFRVAIDKCADKVAELSAKRSEAGKHGGRPKKQTDNEESKKTNCFFEKANESKKSHIDKDKDIDTDKDKDKDNYSIFGVSESELQTIAHEKNDLYDYAEHCGMTINEAVMYRLDELYSQYGLQKCEWALDECATHGVSTIAYMTGVLKGNGKKQETKVGHVNPFAVAAMEQGAD